MDGFKKKINDIISKIKSIKHIEIIFAIAGVALMIIIFSGFKTSSKTSETPKESTQQQVQTDDYITTWEKKLANILSGIDGVGRAEVMITTLSTAEKVTANTTSTATTVSGNGSNSTTSVTASPVLVNGGGSTQPYIIMEKMPEIMGVIVVAEGADNAIIKLSIMRAVQTVLNVDSSKVEIYPMK